MHGTRRGSGAWSCCPGPSLRTIVKPLWPRTPTTPRKTSKKYFLSKDRRKVALKSPKYPLIRDILGDLRATFFVWEMLVVDRRVFRFRGWKSPQGLYNRSNPSLRCGRPSGSGHWRSVTTHALLAGLICQLLKKGDCMWRWNPQGATVIFTERSKMHYLDQGTFMLVL